MDLKDHEWGFTINSETGDLQIIIPKQELYTWDELTGVLMSAVHFCTVIKDLMARFLDNATDALAKAEGGKDKKKEYQN
jgi:hypothetical protein